MILFPCQLYPCCQLFRGMTSTWSRLRKEGLRGGQLTADRHPGIPAMSQRFEGPPRTLSDAQLAITPRRERWA